MSLSSGLPFTGTATALITPFKDGALDENSLEKLIEFQIGNGIDALVLGGTTGESATMSPEEYERLLRLGGQMIGHRVPLIAGAGSNCTATAVQKALVAQKAGCDGILCVTPYYNKASSEGLCRHYETIADATELPLVLYNVPSRTGVKLGMNEYKRLADHPRIVAVKEASGDVALCGAILAELGDRMALYSGSDELNLPLYALGAKGAISVVSNILPKEMGELFKYCAGGQTEKARALSRRLWPVCRVLFSEVNPIPVKYAASLFGLCLPEYRLPLCAPAPATQSEIGKVLSSFAGA